METRASKWLETCLRHACRATSLAFCVGHITRAWSLCQTIPRSQLGLESTIKPLRMHPNIAQRVYNNAAGRVVNDFWDFFTCAKGFWDRANVVVEKIAMKLVHDMHYEWHVQYVIKYHAEYLEKKTPKKEARSVHLNPAEYLNVIPR